MRRFSAVLLALVLVACQDITDPSRVPIDPQTPQPLASMSSQGAAERVVPGRVLAKFQAGVAAEDVAGPLGLTVAGRGYAGAFAILRGASGSEAALAATLRRDSRVVYAEPDYLREPTVDPDLRLWAFYNPGNLSIRYTRGWNRGSVVSNYLSTTDADEDAGGPGTEWGSYAGGGTVVKVGSIDTGVQFDHAAFNGLTFFKGSDWYSGDGSPDDEDGHGTHTTGTMVGDGVGVAWASGAGTNIHVYVQRVCGALGCPTSAIASAIMEAADAGVVAMNLSLGGSSESQSEKDAITYATNAGALVIASAGNGGTGTVSCPACDPKAIAVGATNWQDGLTYYTNWGTGLDIVAPGGEMYSNTTEESGIYSAYLGGGYRYLQGTSMAAPQVTGTAAVVASTTGLRGADLRSRLLQSADGGSYNTTVGCGRLNSHDAVTGTSLRSCEDPTTGGGSDPGSGSPTAAFSYSCGGNNECAFAATTSAGISAYSWNFGDAASNSNTASGATASHVFSGAGSFDVELTITFNGSDTNSVTHTVSCSTKGGRVRCK